MATIYKITNKVNNKCYIGKTIRPVEERWKEHIRDGQKSVTAIPLYNAFKNYGVENFNFEVIETNIPQEQLNEKEREYIALYHCLSHQDGYNVTPGGDGGRINTKLSEEQVHDVIKLLQDKNSLDSFSAIGEEFGVVGSTISSINKGIAWPQDNITYPIRNYDVVGLTINRETYSNIVRDIQNSNLLLKEIQNKYHLSEGQMTAINHGYDCYGHDHPYYQGIYTGKFPIREDKRVVTDEESYIPVFFDVLFSNQSITKIGEKHNIKGNTITCIINGTRRKNLTKDYITPLRKNIAYNQEIFLSLHPEYKEKLP